ncbi:MAG TPA: LysM peptidoglycan-binding domain-containing protein [Methylophilaceae bacterium]|nr:LysM peptidoglycan-binding domain-containing protein [Methylophilaceae bacterium]
MYKYIITPLLLCCLASSAAADDVQLNSDHPDRYVVVKGDTLWGISSKFLKDPWKWPQVWKMNRAQIKNPHRIYPGDVIVLDTSSGEPQLKLLQEKTVTLEPGVVVEPLEKEPVQSISPNIIEPFLSRPLIIEKDALDDAPTIIAGPDNRVALSPGVKVYISGIEENQGRNWHIYRPNKALVDPETQELLGIEALYLGDARVTKYGEPASAIITRAKEEIFVDDKLVAAPDTIQSSFIPHAPDTDIQGRIMTIYGGVAEAGAKTIVSINKGALDGLEQGHVLSINRAGEYVSRNPKNKRTEEKFPMEEFKFKDVDPLEAKSAEVGMEAEKRQKYDPKVDPDENPNLVKLPDERIGLLMIFRTFDRVSYGLIMQASEPVNTLDIVKTP